MSQSVFFSSGPVSMRSEHDDTSKRAVHRHRHTDNHSDMVDQSSMSVATHADTTSDADARARFEQDTASTQGLRRYSPTDSALAKDNGSGQDRHMLPETQAPAEPPSSGSSDKTGTRPSTNPSTNSSSVPAEDTPVSTMTTTGISNPHECDTSSLTDNLAADLSPAIFLTKWATLATNPDISPFPEGTPPFQLTSIDEAQLRLTDAQFSPHTWADLTHLIETGQLDLLKRWPSHLKAYLDWNTHVKMKYGNVLSYILEEKLKWKVENDGEKANGKNGNGHGNDGKEKAKEKGSDSESTFPTHSPYPYIHPSDYTILPNDWPYALEPGVRHLVAWSKHRLPVDNDGALTTEGVNIVEAFITREFRAKGKKVLWFRNPRRLQSVRSLEHVHVLVQE